MWVTVLQAWQLNPVLHVQPRHASKLAHIVAYQGDAQREGVGGDLLIQRANGRALLLQMRPQFTIMLRRAQVVIEDG